MSQTGAVREERDVGAGRAATWAQAVCPAGRVGTPGSDAQRLSHVFLLEQGSIFYEIFWRNSIDQGLRK